MKRDHKIKALIRLTLIGAAIVGTRVLAYAQMEKEDLAIVQSFFTKEKKTIIKSILGIDNGVENYAFWRLYDEYESRKKIIAAERVQLLNEYLEKYYAMDDATASDLTMRLLVSEEQSIDVDKKYYKSFRRLVGGVQATKLFQIELYIESYIQASVHSQTPILGELRRLGVPTSGQLDF